MASERQLAANRRNARKSTGPRSGAGKTRASRNAYRHGLTLSITSTAEYAKQLETLVRKIAGDTTVVSSTRCSVRRTRSGDGSPAGIWLSTRNIRSAARRRLFMFILPLFTLELPAIAA